jgi:subtilisin family serine protease
LGVLATDTGTHDDREGEISGIVTAAPAHPDGIGDWRVRGESGNIYRISADSNTRFEPAPPTLGQSVKVKGEWEADDWLRADRIEQEEADHGDEARVKGILISRPPNGPGEWQIQSARQMTITVVVDSNTRLDDGTPSPGSWLEVRGQWQSDNRLLATRVRLDDHELSEVIVRLRTGVPSATVASRYGLTGRATLLASANIYLFATGEDEEEQLPPQMQGDPDVLWAELNYVGGIPQGHGYKTWRWGGTEGSGYVNQGAFAQINLEAGLQHEQGAGMIIAVLDTGVDLSHPALSGRLLPGYDMVADDTEPQDEGDGLGWGHGTHVSGIIAQVSPQSQLLPVRVLDTNGRGNVFTLAYAIEWAAQQGAAVINLSLGAENDSRVLRDTIAAVTDQGVIVVAAAGNLGNATPQYPASYPHVLSVTAVDGAGVKADFANYGADWVDLAAPGVGITSTMVSSAGSGYASWSGTSMATGFVSGAAALVRKQLPAASVAEIEALFAARAVNLNSQNPGYPDQLGGLLDVGAVVQGDAATPTPTAPAGTPSPTATPTATPTIPVRNQPGTVYLPLIAAN